MKSFRSFAVALAAFALLSISEIQAQPQNHNHDNWMEKMKSEKIALITTELSLTPEEAQVFWPIYNEIEAKKNKTQKAMMNSYFAMLKAIENKASDNEIAKLLDDYLAAKQAYKDADKDEVQLYRKVLSNEKVAKFYVAEEKFRRQQVRNMRGHHGPGDGKPGPVPGPRK